MVGSRDLTRDGEGKNGGIAGKKVEVSRREVCRERHESKAEQQIMVQV